jgi:hypothetical protein
MSAHAATAALSIAAGGRPVLKRPAISQRQDGAGFHDATFTNALTA